MRRVLAISAVVGAATAACFIKPPAPAGGPVRDDAGNLLDDGGNLLFDAAADGSLSDGMFISPDGSIGSCVTENFIGSGSGTCGTTGWATVQAGSGYANLGGDKLTLGLFGSPGAYVHCTSASGAFQRMIVDIAAVAATQLGAETTFVGLAGGDGSLKWGVQFTYHPGSGTAGFAAVCPSLSFVAEQWDSSAMRFVQVEKWMTSSVRISAGSNGSTFTELGVCDAPDVTAGTSVVQLRLLTGGSSSAGASAQFEQIEICR